MRQKQQLPQGWSRTNLKEITTSLGGGTPSKSDASFWTDGTIPWVSPKDMKSFHILSSEDLVTVAALNRLSLVPADSVLVVVRSGILSRTFPVGLSAMPATINQDMRAFVPMDGISSRFLAWQLVAREREILSSCSKHGTTVASIEGPALSAFPLVLAPSAEQTRIVAKLEELLSDIDAGVAELKAAQAKLAQYRQSLLKAAVEGALTADWRARRAALETDRPAQPAEAENRPRPAEFHASFAAGQRRRHKTPPTGGCAVQEDSANGLETGAQLLARILTERRARWEARQLARFQSQGKTPPKGWQNKYPEPVAPDTRDLPELPEGWVWASLEQLSHLVRNGLSDKPTTEQIGFPILRINAVRSMHTDLNEVRYLPIPSEKASDYLLDEGDLLATRYNGSVELLGVVGVVRGLQRPTLHPDKLIRIKPVLSCYIGDWMELSASTGYSRAHIVARAKTTAGQTGISGSDLKSMPVPLPPLAEQARMIELVQTEMANIAAQKLAIEGLIKQSAAQRQNLLKAAFSGQLVPQDPNDEPASVLVERIRALQPARAYRSRKKVTA